MSETPSPRASARSNLRERLSWWLPPLLASLAIAFQYTFDVPKAAMLRRPTAEEKAAEKRAKKRAKAKKRADEKQKKARARKRANTGPWEPRGDEEVARLRRTYSTEPLESEPRDPIFRRHHETILRSAATKVRSAAVGDGKPVSMQIRPSCRTLRCELELCAPEQLLADMAALLPELRVDEDEPLWHEFRELPPREDKRKVGPRRYQCRRWLVDFATEDLTTRALSLAQDEDG